MKRMLMDNCAEECKLQRTKECQEIHLFYGCIEDELIKFCSLLIYCYEMCQFSSHLKASVFSLFNEGGLGSRLFLAAPSLVP